MSNMRLERLSIAPAWSSVIETPLESIGGLQVVAAPGGSSVRERYSVLRRRVFMHLVDRSPWGTSLWEILRARYDDSPYTRARGYWRRYGETDDVPAGAIETSGTNGKKLIRVGAHPIRDSERFLDLLSSGNRRRVDRLGFLLPTETGNGQVEQMMDSVLRLVDGPTYYHAYFARVGVGVATGGAVLMEDETSAHEPALEFYGPISVIDVLESSLANC